MEIFSVVHRVLCLSLLISFLNSCNEEIQQNTEPVSRKDSSHKVSVRIPELKIPEHVPDSIKNTLASVEVNYIDFEGIEKSGFLIVHKDLEKEVIEIFQLLKTIGFPIDKINPLSYYGWDDVLSMEDNNTSAFNYRRIKNSKQISNHALGCALDLNPVQNPFVKRGVYSPSNAYYEKDSSGVILKEGKVVQIFKSFGWSWGGDWRSVQDYEHFEKKLTR